MRGRGLPAEGAPGCRVQPRPCGCLGAAMAPVFPWLRTSRPSSCEAGPFPQHGVRPRPWRGQQLWPHGPVLPGCLPTSGAGSLSGRGGDPMGSPLSQKALVPGSPRAEREQGPFLWLWVLWWEEGNRATPDGTPAVPQKSPQSWVLPLGLSALGWVCHTPPGGPPEPGPQCSWVDEEGRDPRPPPPNAASRLGPRGTRGTSPASTSLPTPARTSSARGSPATPTAPTEGQRRGGQSGTTPGLPDKPPPCPMTRTPGRGGSQPDNPRTKPRG